MAVNSGVMPRSSSLPPRQAGKTFAARRQVQCPGYVTHRRIRPYGRPRTLRSMAPFSLTERMDGHGVAEQALPAPYLFGEDQLGHDRHPGDGMDAVERRRLRRKRARRHEPPRLLDPPGDGDHRGFPALRLGLSALAICRGDGPSRYRQASGGDHSARGFHSLDGQRAVGSPTLHL